MAEGKTQPTKPKMGRPSIYSKELATQFCFLISTGMSLRTVCKRDDMPSADTIFRWLGDDKDFSEQYTRATEERANAFAEEILEIADDGTNDFMEDNYDQGKTPGYALNGENIQRSKLRVDTRKWLMSKMQPKKYGDKLDVTSGGEKLPSPIVDLTARVTNVIDDVEHEHLEDGE